MEGTKIQIFRYKSWEHFFFRELADLHKANAAKDCEVQEAALSHEMKVKEELGLILEKAHEEAHQQQEALAIQVSGQLNVE